MKPKMRREQIADQLMQSREPLTGHYFAEKYGVSRQVIVGDMAALRASEIPISATPQGYIYCRKQSVTARYKLRHTNEQTEDELRLIVSLGGGIEDVMVRHHIYGELRARLDIYTQADVDHFMEQLRQGKSVPLMNITSGYHYHTITAKNQNILDDIVSALRLRGYLVE